MKRRGSALALAAALLCAPLLLWTVRREQFAADDVAVRIVKHIDVDGECVNAVRTNPLRVRFACALSLPPRVGAVVFWPQFYDYGLSNVRANCALLTHPNITRTGQFDNLFTQISFHTTGSGLRTTGGDGGAPAVAAA